MLDDVFCNRRKTIKDFVKTWAICKYQFHYWCRFCEPTPESNILFQDPLPSAMNSRNLCERYVYLVLLTPEKQFVKYIHNDLTIFHMTVLFNRMNLLALKYLCCLEQNCLWLYYISYWWRNHFTVICLRYIRIWRRGQKNCAIWEETTQLFVQNPLFCFLTLLFEIYPVFIVCLIFLWNLVELKGNVGIY